MTLQDLHPVPVRKTCPLLRCEKQTPLLPRILSISHEQVGGPGLGGVLLPSIKQHPFFRMARSLPPVMGSCPPHSIEENGRWYFFLHIVLSSGLLRTLPHSPWVTGGHRGDLGLYDSDYVEAGTFPMALSLRDCPFSS